MKSYLITSFNTYHEGHFRFISFQNRLETMFLKSVSVTGIKENGEKSRFANGDVSPFYLFKNVTLDEIRSVLKPNESVNLIEVDESTTKFDVKLNLKNAVTICSSKSAELKEVPLSIQIANLYEKLKGKDETVFSGEKYFDLNMGIHNKFIKFIRIEESLSGLEIFMDKRCSSAEFHAPAYCMKSSESEIGQLNLKYYSSICFFGCKTLKSDPEEILSRACMSLREAGLVHTIQYPIAKLLMQGFINEAQFIVIAKYIKYRMQVAQLSESDVIIPVAVRVPVAKAHDQLSAEVKGEADLVLTEMKAKVSDGIDVSPKPAAGSLVKQSVFSVKNTDHAVGVGGELSPGVSKKSGP